MSASHSPPNPASPKKSLRGPPSGALGRRVAVGAAIFGLAYYLFPTAAPRPPGEPQSNILKTPGVQNVENAYANGGATTTHVKGYGGSIQGQKGSGPLRESAGTGKPKGFNEEGIGEEQRPGNAGVVGEKFNDMKYGSSKGK